MDITIQSVLLLILLIICNGAEFIIFAILDMQLPTVLAKPYLDSVNITRYGNGTKLPDPMWTGAIELIYASKYIPGLVLSIPTMFLVRENYKTTYVLGMLVHCTAGVSLAFGQTQVTYMAANGLSGLAMVFTTASLPKIFREIFPGETAYSRMVTFAMETRLTGIALSLVLGAKAWDSLDSFYSAGVVCTIYLTLTALVILLTSTCCCWQKKITLEKKTDDEKLKLTNTDSPMINEQSSSRRLRLVLYVQMVISFICTSIVQNTTPWRLQLELKFTPMENGAVLALAMYAASFTALVVVLAESHSKRIGLLILVGVLQAVGIALYPWVSTYRLACVAEVFIQGGKYGYLFLASSMAISMDSTAEDTRHPSGVFQTVHFASLCFGSFIANFLYEMFSFSLLYWSLSGIVGLMAVSSFALCR